MSGSLREPLAQAPTWSRTIVYHASRDALGPKTDVILSRLGYQMLLPETFESMRAKHPELEAELLVIDERRIEEADAYRGDGPGPPVVLLTGTQGATGEDPRIVGAVKRPAGLHDLYRLMQQVFEDVPRSTPRVATQLRARCASGGSNWEGRVLSLSENGCLIRSPEAILLGQKVELELVLPRSESIALEAEATYQLLPDTGLVWSAIDAGSREALGRFVTQTILA
ncbi:MAG: PilZ domain-containing protein [bacterium]|nr:PilZ domain-containing protein [bacterium]